MRGRVLVDEVLVNPHAPLRIRAQENAHGWQVVRHIYGPGGRDGSEVGTVQGADVDKAVPASADDDTVARQIMEKRDL